MSYKSKANGKITIFGTKMIMLVAVALAFVLPLVSLFNIMILKSDFYQGKAAAQQLYDTEISARRGNIYDRNMNLLATSATVWTVYVTPNDFSKIKNEETKNNVKEEIATN